MQFLPEVPIHPGEILREDFLPDYGLSADKVASDIGIDEKELRLILDANAPITAELALRLSRYFANSPEFWLNLQRNYDLAVAVKAVGGLDAITPVRAA